MAGLSHAGGPLVDGWDHTRESIADILRTPIGSRIMRRDYGSRLPEMVDELSTPRSILALWVAVADSLELWEPRFAVTNLSISALAPEAMATGRITLGIWGTYYPLGHLGDYTRGAAGDLSVTL